MHFWAVHCVVNSRCMFAQGYEFMTRSHFPTDCGVVTINMIFISVDFLSCDDLCQFEASQHSEELQSCTNLMPKPQMIF